MMQLETFSGALPADLLALLEAKEADIVAEVSARDDTYSFIIRDGVALLGYGVFGLGKGDDMVIIYAARSFNSFATKMAMMGLFGAAQVLGVPVRVHTDKMRTMARMLGAERFMEALDGDGLRVGVFHGV